MRSLLALLLLVPTAFTLSPRVVIRDSPISVPFAVNVKNLGPGGVTRMIEADKARARHFSKVADEKMRKVVAGELKPDAAIGVSATNGAVTYTASVGIGKPATYYTLLIDTGSSNTWMGANKKYVVTSTSHKTPNNVSVHYGIGSFSGTEYTDQVTLAPKLVIPKQSLGVASSASDIQDVDGILGIGPVDLTQGTLSAPADAEIIPTVTDNLFREGKIPKNMIGISFEPATRQHVKSGVLTFGGADTSKFTGKITYVPVTKTRPANEFWGIDQSVRFGSSTTILNATAGIVDTGTTLILLASDAFSAYRKATGAVQDDRTGLLRVTPAQFKALKSLYFAIGDTTFELTPNAQIWPRSLNTLIEGDPDSIYLVVGDLGTPSGGGIDFVNGFAFLERFYSVYDTKNKRVGIATTPFTHATTN